MTETSQLGLEPTVVPSVPEDDGANRVPLRRGRDWFLGLLVIAFVLAFLVALGIAVLILLSAVLPAFSLQTFSLALPPTLPPLLQTTLGRLSLLQVAFGLLLGSLFLALVFYLLARWRVVGKRFLWPSAGCPACGHETLVRVHRRSKDRLYTWIGFPAGRYHCRECRWQGLRIRRGAEHSSISTDWAATVAAARSDNSTNSLSRTTPGEDEGANLGPFVYNGSNEKWNARLNDLALQDNRLPVSAEISAESGSEDKDQMPPTQEDASHDWGAAVYDPEETLSGAQTLPPMSSFESRMDQHDDRSADQEPEHEAARGRIASPFGLNLRSGPGSDADLIGLLAPGTAVLLLGRVTGNDGRAWQCVASDQRQGWVLSTFVDDEE